MEKPAPLAKKAVAGKAEAWRLPEVEIAALAAGRHHDPFAVLGPHDTPDGLVIRAFVPNAESVLVVSPELKEPVALRRRHDDGVFEGLAAGAGRAYHLHAANAGGEWDVEDPYRFGPLLGQMDDYLYVEGTHLRLWDKLGARPVHHEGVDGVHFAVWAPHARRVSIVGDFNNWDGRRHPMRKRIDTGVWEIFLPGVHPGAYYKYEIIGPNGALLPLKSDPFAFATELRPGTASRVLSAEPFAWTDQQWIEDRARRDARMAPMSTYEVHLGSWKRGDHQRFLSYDEFADQLVTYVAHMGYTHIELLPVSEHPLDASWGYQPTGLFAPTSRFGSPEGFARFVNKAHEAGIGVILDWVPAHFPTDSHGLAWFDGGALYEHPDPRRGFHPDWNTAIYDFGRREVANFLIANALFWLERFHIDGLRVDAVASMLYLDYSRKAGEWIPNIHGGRENLDAIAFLQRMNKEVYAAHPGVMTIAEESTAWPGVSKPVYDGGLGFGFKWNMGFMHDTLDYMEREPIYRQYHHDDLTFGLIYAFAENFVLPLSHDEVVHGKNSIVNKMSGLEGDKFATLRAYYTMMWAYPGKKLLFMGQDFGQRREWNENVGLDWDLMQYGPHKGLSDLVRDLNHIYRGRPALHERDCEGDGFEWMVVDDNTNSVFAWARYASDVAPIVMVANLTPVARNDYVLPLPLKGQWRELLNSDSELYFGLNRGNLGGIHAQEGNWKGKPAMARINLPPLTAILLEWAGN
ncbi:1,4-alpha-glucan branching protein GlgB [Labrys okinawensis]|uniref:1,4-alpha-glucan branching protein GlgB n=1 Tax=Labrys okinawensis TaxID=346911 RepID=UPI0039BC3E87